MQTSFVHNWRWSFTVLVAVMLITAGFSCNGDRERQTATSGDDAGTTPTTWTTYRSENLGVSIPYPEGWYVRESRNDDVTTILIDSGPLPPVGAGSDFPVRVTVTVTQLSLDDVLVMYESATTTVVEFNGTRVTKVAYSSGLGSSTNEPLHREAYHWNVTEGLYTVDGAKDDATVAYIASALAAREE